MSLANQFSSKSHTLSLVLDDGAPLHPTTFDLMVASGTLAVVLALGNIIGQFWLIPATVLACACLNQVVVAWQHRQRVEVCVTPGAHRLGSAVTAAQFQKGWSEVCTVGPSQGLAWHQAAAGRKDRAKEGRMAADELKELMASEVGCGL